MFSYPRAGPWLTFVAFLVLSIAVYAPSFDNSFHGDDFVFLRAAVGIHGPDDLAQHIRNFAFYRPGAVLLFGLEYRMFGLEHGGAYHVFNFVIHILNSLCLVLVLRGMQVALRTACVAGGLFAAGFGHYGKEVMWACTSGGLFAVLLVLGVLWLTAWYTGAPDGSRPSSWKIAIGAGIPMLVAPAFHEMGLAAPFLAAALLWAYRGRPGADGVGNPAASRAPVAWPVFVPAALTLLVWALIYITVSGEHKAYRGVAEAALRRPSVLLRYLGFMLVPIKESALIHGQPLPVQWLLRISPILQMALGTAAMAASVFLLVRGKRATKFLIVWLYGALVLFCVVGMPAGWLELRYVYFASIPLCALLATELFQRLRARGKFWHPVAWTLVAAATVMTAYVTLTLERKYAAEALHPSNRERLENLMRIRSTTMNDRR